MREDLARVFRVSDTLVTCHSILRDSFSRRALLLDVLILIASVWVTAMALVDVEIAKRISFPGVSPAITIGLIAIFTFVLSLIQLRVDWKSRADRHERAARAYAASKLEIGSLENRENITNQEIEVVLTRYRLLGDSCIAIPDSQFNKLKKKHLIKVSISKEIGRHPGTSIWLIRAKLWLADSVGLFRGGNREAS